MLSDVDPIERSAVAESKDWETLEEIIEKPLRAAMHDLWEKGIKTWQCSANRKDISKGIVFFEIRADKEFLSQENYDIAMANQGEEIKRGEFSFFRFSKPISGNVELATIVTWSRSVSNMFQSQKLQKVLL